MISARVGSVLILGPIPERLKIFVLDVLVDFLHSFKKGRRVNRVGGVVSFAMLSFLYIMPSPSFLSGRLFCSSSLPYFLFHQTDQ